jgi:hypothetical protein
MKTSREIYHEEANDFDEDWRRMIYSIFTM